MRSPVLLVFATVFAFPTAAGAQPARTESGARETAAPKDVREEVPLAGYTQSAFGASARTVGAAMFCEVVGGAAGASGPELGGGARVWGSPVDRLTLLVQVDRRPLGGSAAPSAAAAVRIFGDREAGWAAGGLVRYRTEGFAALGGEVESAAMLSFARRGFHADTNVVFGTAVEEREMDGELELRLGYDAASWLRVGLDGRFRYRLAGLVSLPGDRRGDAVGGPEVMLGYRNVFMAVGGGPSTVGIATSVGWATTATFGGAIL